MGQTLRDAAKFRDGWFCGHCLLDDKDELHMVEHRRVTDGHQLQLALIIGQFLVSGRSAHSGICLLIHSFTQPLTRTRTHSLTHAHIHSLTHQSLIH